MVLSSSATSNFVFQYWIRLYADTRKGRRPSWSAAAPGPVAEPLVDAFVEVVRGYGLKVATGRFGADMAVELVNDGPVTLLLEA